MPNYKLASMSTVLRESMLDLIKVKHAHQTRNGDLHTPYWWHCLSAADILQAAIDGHTAATDSTMRENLYLATLGHDLYEDTDVDPAHIAEAYGTEVDRLIRAMTNEVSDEDRASYLEKLTNATDDVLLIKFADLIDNTECVATNRAHFAPSWINEFYIPVATETSEILRSHTFGAEWAPVAAALLGRLTTAMADLLPSAG